MLYRTGDSSTGKFKNKSFHAESYHLSPSACLSSSFGMSGKSVLKWTDYLLICYRFQVQKKIVISHQFVESTPAFCPAHFPQHILSRLFWMRCQSRGEQQRKVSQLANIKNRENPFFKKPSLKFLSGLMSSWHLLPWNCFLTHSGLIFVQAYPCVLCLHVNWILSFQDHSCVSTEVCPCMGQYRIKKKGRCSRCHLLPLRPARHRCEAWLEPPGQWGTPGGGRARQGAGKRNSPTTTVAPRGARHVQLLPAG